MWPLSGNGGPSGQSQLAQGQQTWHISQLVLFPLSAPARHQPCVYACGGRPTRVPDLRRGNEGGNQEGVPTHREHSRWRQAQMTTPELFANGRFWRCRMLTVSLLQSFCGHFGGPP